MANITTITTLVRGLIKDQIRKNNGDEFEVEADDKFTLQEDFPVESSINVYKNDELMNTTDWSYSSDTNQVIIDPVTSGVVLDPGDTIVISYNYYEKYSDSEIIDFIKSSLIWFAVYRYKKLFEVASDDEDVIAINAVNPTTEEQYLIAMITAIEIDPNNVDIRTPDFQLTGSENKSKKDQIGDVFSKWLRFVGTIDFLEDEC